VAEGSPPTNETPSLSEEYIDKLFSEEEKVTPALNQDELLKKLKDLAFKWGNHYENSNSEVAYNYGYMDAMAKASSDLQLLLGKFGVF
jgi:hypothetical protein